jgi:hypothetical protein
MLFSEDLFGMDIRSSSLVLAYVIDFSVNGIELLHWVFICVDADLCAANVLMGLGYLLRPCNIYISIYMCVYITGGIE